MLRIRLLGPVEVTNDGVPLSLPPRAVGVLVRLAVESGPIDRDRLLIDLWGDDVAPSKRRSLETLVSTLRSVATGRDGLVFRTGTYALTIPVELDIAPALDAARLGRSPTTGELASIATAATRGEPSIHRLGDSHWLDELDRDVRATIEIATSANRHVPPPQVRYATSGERHLAYQARDGERPTVLLYAGLATHCEGVWDAPGFATWVSAAFGNRRFIMFDKRGCGRSDPIDEVPTSDDFVADTIAVLDAAGVDRVVAVCAAEAGLWAPTLAASHPDRVDGFVFFNAVPKMFEADDYPCGLPERVATEFGESVRDNWARADTDDEAQLSLSAPSRAHDRDFRAWAKRYQAMTGSPGSVWHLARYTAEADARHDVAAIRQPCLVVQSRHSRYFRPSTADWWCAELGVEEPVWLDTSDHLFWTADPQRSARVIAAFLDDV